MVQKFSKVAMLVIGDEILSGRTRDANINTVALWLSDLGIELAEARIIADVHDEIVATIQELSRKYDAVFTSGGIGPTHDDITADAVAAAFGLKIDHDPRAVALLEDYYPPEMRNEARMRMARIPDNARLIDNPVSVAPGFVVENVYVMAGVPKIFAGMLEGLVPEFSGGTPLLSETLRVEVGEGQIAAVLGALQAEQSDVKLGCYPYGHDGKYAARVVARGRDRGRLRSVLDILQQKLVDMDITSNFE
ncbi:MAG: competence/damage-inducible protein A [Alphaproteobacteria bacterium]